MSGTDTKWKKFVSVTTEIVQSLIAIFCAYIVAFFRVFVAPVEKIVENDVALITGSGSGIGRKLSVEFAKRGSRVVLWDIDKTANDETAAIIRGFGGICHSYVCDVGSRSEVYRVAELVRREVGEVSILVNNAGIVTGKSFVELPDDLIEKTFNVNLLAHFWTTHTTAFIEPVVEHWLERKIAQTEDGSTQKEQ